MIIGYSGEGSNDAFVIEALQEMWCPEARVEVAQWRGATGSRRKHEIRKACIELFEKNASLIIFFTDSNNRDYKIVKRNESEWIPDNYRAMTIYAVADRNIECWIVADKEKAKKEMGSNKKQLEGDPVKFVNKHFGSYRDSDKKRKIKEFVKSSNTKEWLKNSKSFGAFYKDCKNMAITHKCVSFPKIG